MSIRTLRPVVLRLMILAGIAIAPLTAQPAWSQDSGSSAPVRGRTPTAAKYLGCYADRQARDLPEASFQAADMTADGCQAYCREKGFAYAGTQYGSQCFCGNSFGQYGSLPESSCNAGCAGNAKEQCGGTWANSVYSLTGQSPPLSQRMRLYSRGIVANSFAYLPRLISLALAFGLLLSLVGIASGFWVYREYRLVKNTPQSSVRSIAKGFVHVHGKSAVENPLTSPLTQTPCCYYRTNIEHWAAGGSRHAGGWKEFFHEQDEKEFYLDDGTGKVLVNPKGAEYVLPELYQVEISAIGVFGGGGVRNLKIDPAFNRDNAPSEGKVRDYLAKHGATNANISHRITEYGLVVEREYSVFGTFDIISDSQNPDYRDKIQKGKKVRTFVITALSDQKLRGYEGCRAIGWIVGGAIMAALFLLLLLGSLHVY